MKTKTESKTASHTPGPWRVQLQDDLSASGNGYVWAVKASHAGAEYVQNPAYANSKANAVLIAAAPELLQACQLALVRLSGGSSAEIAFNKNVADKIAEAINKATITKATGGRP